MKKKARIPDMFPGTIPPAKQRIWTEQQKRAIGREKVKRYFEKVWKEKYKHDYAYPAHPFPNIDSPLNKAIDCGISSDALCLGIDRYLKDEFKGYVENLHPFSGFIKNMNKFIIPQEKEQSQGVSAEDKAFLAKEYGLIVHANGDLETDDGKIFPAQNRKKAIALMEWRKKGFKDESFVYKGD